MALSIDSILVHILADEKGKAILEKYFPDIERELSVPQEVAYSRSLKWVAECSEGRITDEMLKAIAEDLSKI